jgi:hypothetical protein
MCQLYQQAARVEQNHVVLAAAAAAHPRQYLQQERHSQPQALVAFTAAVAAEQDACA